MPRKTSSRRKGAIAPGFGRHTKPNTAASEALKRAWQDPEKRARMQLKKNGNRYGVPDGMRKWQAEPIWEEARQKADYLMAELEKEKVITFGDTPEDEMGKTALREAFVIAMSPLDAKTKLHAIEVVLNYTKAKPATKTDLTLASHEAWLQAVVEDHNESRASEEVPN